MKMTLSSSKLKKTGTALISIVTLGLPLFVFQSYFRGIQEEYLNLQIWLPIHPYTASIASAIPYFSVFGLMIYLYRESSHLGEVKLLTIVFLLLIFAILTQIALSFYIINYR
jgi:hypothetical protein